MYTYTYRTDCFSLLCGDVGKPSTVVLRHDNTGISPAWYCEHVTISCDAHTTVCFPCDQWVESCDGCGGQLTVELVPEDQLQQKGNYYYND